jgi:Tfp pilus assembly protein PilF
MRPADLTPYQAGAEAWLAAEDPAKAIHNLEAAIEADPADETSYTMLADVYARQNDVRGQIRVLDRYLAFRPQSIEFRLRRRALGSGPAVR